MQILGWFSAEAARASRWKRERACGSLAASCVQEFQRDKAMKLHILGFVDNTHPPAAQFLDDAVVRDGLADHARKAPSQEALIVGGSEHRSQ